MNAQEESAVQFHGTNIISGQLSNWQDTVFSSFPRNFIRNDLNMSLSIHGIPIAARFFITTEALNMEQSIDNLTLYIDVNTVKRNRARIESRNSKADREKEKVPGLMKFLSNFKRIEAVRVRPNYSELTISGVAVDGVNIEYQPNFGKRDKIGIYAAFSTGRVVLSEAYKNKVDRNLLFGKAGLVIGKRSHLLFTYMQIEDKATNLSGEDTLKPSTNQVGEVDLRITFGKKTWLWTTTGKAAVSVLTRDNQFIYKADSLFESLPAWVVNFINPNLSTSGDYAYSAGTQLALNYEKYSLSLAGSYHQIGSGYITLGNPNLINDRETIEARLDQSFTRKKSVGLSLFYRKFRNNLINWRSGTTYSTIYGLSLRLMFPRYPFLEMGYSASDQQKNDTVYSIDNFMHIFTASTGYSYRLGTVRSYSGFNFMYQDADLAWETDTGNSSTQSYTFNQMFAFQVPFTLDFNINYNNNQNQNLTEFKQKILAYSLSGTLSSFQRRWENTLGGRLQQVNNNDTVNQNKLNLFWKTRYNFRRFASFEVILEENVFRADASIGGNYDEFIMRMNLIFKW